MTHFTRLFASLLVLTFVAASAFAHESPVDHVSRELRLWFADGRIHLSYRVILTERAVLLQLHAMDANRDGKISDDERKTCLTAAATDLAGRLHIKLGEREVTLRPSGDVVLDPALGQTFTFVTDDDILLPAGKHPAELLDFYSRAYPGPYRVMPTTDGSITITQNPDVSDKHPAMVIMRFELTMPGK